MACRYATAKVHRRLTRLGLVATTLPADGHGDSRQEEHGRDTPGGVQPYATKAVEGHRHRTGVGGHVRAAVGGPPCPASGKEDAMKRTRSLLCLVMLMSQLLVLVVAAAPPSSQPSLAMTVYLNPT